jgi:hypothetical protein
MVVAGALTLSFDATGSQTEARTALANDRGKA